MIRFFLAATLALAAPAAAQKNILDMHCHLSCLPRTVSERDYDRLLPLFAKYPNLYGDISATTQFNRIGFLKKALKEPSLRGRLLYGTDRPLQYFPVVSPWCHLGGISPLEARALGVPEEVFTAGWAVFGRKVP